MVEIKCPACGAAGRAPKAKIETRLICRKCLKVFHVTPSGKTVLGEPTATGQTATAASPRTNVLGRIQNVDQWFERVSRTLFSPRSWILAGGLILLVAAAVLFATWHPETLEDRVARAAKAAVQGDLRTIEELAAPGTEGDMGTWYFSVRSQCDQVLKRLGSSKLVVETEVKPEYSGQDKAEVIAWVSTSDDLVRRGRALPDPTIVAASSNPSPVSLPMFWRSEGWGGWRLDLKRTLELSKAMP